MLFKKNKPVVVQSKFTSKNKRITYDRDYLMLVVKPTEEELELLKAFPKNLVALNEDSSKEEMNNYEFELTDALYNLFVLYDPKNFAYYSDKLTVKNDDIESIPAFICPFIVGASYDLKTNLFAFFVNPIFYTVGNIDYDIDFNKKYDVIPEIEIFEELYKLVFETLEKELNERN